MRWVGAMIYFVPAVALAAEQSPLRSATLDADLLIKALGFVVAAIVAYIQARGLYLTSRTSLKTDLEILKLLEPTDPSYQTVRRSIDVRIAHLYAPREPGAAVQRWGVAIFGLVWALGFSYWTFRLLRPGFTWWSLLTAYLALGGVGWVFIGVFGKPFLRGFFGPRTREGRA